MKYKTMQCNVSNNSISEYKVFEGIKLYSQMSQSEDGKTLTNQRVFVMKKQNYVYYERTDVNWNYWSGERKYDDSFDLNEIKQDIKFEISSKLEDFTILR